jgi:hypothetical protein
MQITTPEEIHVGNATVTVRNPTAVWLLGFFTLGIYLVVWTYQTSRELRDYSQAVTRPFQVSPLFAAILVALWPLGLWPGMLGTYMLARRARTVQDWTEAEGRLSPILAALLFVVFFVHAFYVQRGLNEAWAGAKAGRGPEPDYAVATGQDARLGADARARSSRAPWS